MVSLVIEVPLHELRRSGAMKSKPSAARTNTVATTSAVLTSRFGNGRAHARFAFGTGTFRTVH